MSNNSSIATHDGVVIGIQPGKISIEMQVVSACASCKAHEKCAFVDKDRKVVEIETAESDKYHIGDNVTVCVNESRGLLAVLFAYLLPALLLVGSVVLLTLLSASETLVATATILLIAAYFLLLFLLRTKLQKKFTFTLK